jgi:hypothetical protein
MIIGKYVANAIIYTGSAKNDTMTATTTFIVFPLRIVAIIILVVIVLYLLRKRLSRSLKALAGK